jgi:hypothetical protein
MLTLLAMRDLIYDKSLSIQMLFALLKELTETRS